MSKELNNQDWYGTRTVQQSEKPCGYCNDSFHDKCAHEIGWYDRLWICGCECNKSWKPQQIVIAKKTKTPT